MKGIILAGGTGSRLAPITYGVCKQLLPVYDKPMIHYPLGTLMLAGIKDILIIGTPEDLPRFQNLLGDGSTYGINLTYAEQLEPKGIAEALLIGEDFLNGSSCMLALGDNIFSGPQFHNLLKEAIAMKEGAGIFSYLTRDPSAFGVVELDMDSNIISIEEKPEHPKSNYVATGLYVYDNTASERVRNLAPSPRGELEITDLNNSYLKDGKIRSFKLPRGFAWFDTGTPASLLEASNYIGITERVQGLKIMCLEEMAWRLGFITAEEFDALIGSYKKSPYVDYLKHIRHVS
jgi:glucose-1-phosphate thymidylyltransferase